MSKKRRRSTLRGDRYEEDAAEYSTAASQKQCASAILGYGKMKAAVVFADHPRDAAESAAHVYQTILQFCVRPSDRK
jgi:hypothetical protein